MADSKPGRSKPEGERPVAEFQHARGEEGAGEGKPHKQIDKRRGQPHTGPDNADGGAQRHLHGGTHASHPLLSAPGGTAPSLCAITLSTQPAHNRWSGRFSG